MVDEAQYDLFTSYFVPPEPGEGFNVVVHTPQPSSRSLRPFLARSDLAPASQNFVGHSGIKQTCAGTLPMSCHCPTLDMPLERKAATTSGSELVSCGSAGCR